MHRRVGIGKGGQILLAIAESERLRDLDAGLHGLRIFDRLPQHRHEPGLACPVRPQQHDPVFLADELLSGLEQQPAVRCRDSGIIQRDQNLGMRAAVGQLDRPCGSFQVCGFCRLFQLFGSLLQLFRLLQQQVATGIDTDIVKLCSVLAKLLGRLDVTPVAPLIRCIHLAERGTRPRIGQRKYL